MQSKTEQDIDYLMSHIGEVGNRIAFSSEETQAKVRLVAEMKKLGLDVQTDDAGNIYGILYAKGKPPAKGFPLKVMGVGSHIDSVPDGGNFDGLVGIVNGLAMIKEIQEQGITLRENIAVIAFACEESTVFGKSCLGSKFISGKISADDLRKTAIVSDRFDDGLGLRYDEKVASCNDILKLPRLDRKIAFTAFFESHIEQGPILIDGDKKIGIVSSIAAPFRVKFTLTGKGGHDGTVPMEKRRDALVGFNELYNIYRDLRHEMNIGDRLRTNMGVVDIENSSINKIPAKLSTTVSARGLDVNLMNKFMERLIVRVERKLPEIGIKLETKRLEQGIPVHLNPKIVDVVRKNAKGYPSTEMWSGAGHDTAYMSEICREGAAVFFIPNTGISHEPTEFATIEDIAIGTKVLTEIVRNRQLERKTIHFHKRGERSV